MARVTRSMVTRSMARSGAEQDGGDGVAEVVPSMCRKSTERNDDDGTARVTRSMDKKRTGFASQPRKKRVDNAFWNLPHEIATAREELRLKRLRKREHATWKLRVQKLCEQVVGVKPVFSGFITIPDRDIARATDEVRLADIAEFSKWIPIAVYWVDGSYMPMENQHAGFMGAGVVWWEGDSLCTIPYKLGRYTGDHEDAEVFAIAAALGRAKKQIERGANLKLVRIYSDSSSVLERLLRGTLYVLGPLIAARPALQAIYERTAWLTDHGARVELIWVKGHSKSKGNVEADRTATRAVQEQIAATQDSKDEPPLRQLLTEGQVPEFFKESGSDWVEEWLWRANMTTKSRTGALTAKEKDWLQSVADDVDSDS
jgi:ribonuclease HI